MKNIVKLLLVVLLILGTSSMAAAAKQNNKTVPNTKSKPVSAEAEVQPEKPGIPVVIDQIGNDVIGGSLALKLKENFRKSVLFKLVDKNSKAVRIRVVSRSEFAERPEIGSVYVVLWTFAESQDVVPFYLSEELGVVSDRTVDSAAAALMNRTDKLAAEYKYLFE